MVIDDKPSSRVAVLAAVNHSDVKEPQAALHSHDQASESSADSSRPRSDVRNVRKRRSGGADGPVAAGAAAPPSKVARTLGAAAPDTATVPQRLGGGTSTLPSKKARMSWDAELHRSFLAALQKLGLRAAVPKTIMQEMGVSALSRENVASHLQKYRLALKRASSLSDNAAFDDSTWPLLESAHVAHLASHGLARAPPEQPTATAQEPSDATVHIKRAAPAPAPSAARATRAATRKPEPAQALTAHTDGAPAARPSLPPLPPASMPISAPFPQPPSSCAASGLPAGFALPAPNSAGEAVGVPVPVHMFPSSATPPPVTSACTGQKAGAEWQPRKRAQDGNGSSLAPLALPERPASLMPSGFDAERLQSCIAQAGGFLPSYGGGDSRTCTVYMVKPAAVGTGAPAADGFMQPAQVPQMMVAVSMAAYNPATQPAIAADGAPVAANSTGSAAVAQQQQQQQQHQQHRQQCSPQPARQDTAQRSSSQSESAGPRTPSASARPRRGGLRRSAPRRSSHTADTAAAAGADSGADEPLLFGSSNALDVLAEVAGKLAGEDAG